MVDIATLGISAPVDPVGVEESGWVEIPEDVNRVGWYRFGTGLGTEQGSTVIVGHRDGYNQGAGAFYSVGALAPGDTFTITGEDQREYSYEVVAREVFTRSELPVDELFRETGSSVVTLISCTGYFDRDQGGYRENVVVTAIPREVQRLQAPPTSRVGPI
jgi:LPXTG-site transpeptidase (sortase) family protein